VEVTASAATVDSERASAATLISPDALVNLPIFNRSFTSLATLTPQVTIADRGNIAIGGQRGINTSVNIDGGDNNESFFGGATGAAEGKTPFTVSLEAVREYQVITDGASAEFGRMGGGYLNAITKSGTNDFTGSLFYYDRLKSLVALPPKLSPSFDPAAAVGDFKDRNIGFSIGGPIIKDKLFFFVAFEAVRRTDSINFVWGGATPVALDPATNPSDSVLLAKGYNYSYKSDSNVTFARLDWLVNANHSLQLRANISDFKGVINQGITVAEEGTSTDDIKTTNLVGQWNWTIGGSWINEFRINVLKDDQPRNPRSTQPQVSISNVGSYGEYPFGRVFKNDRLQFMETLSYITPTLQVKGGIDYNKTRVKEVFASFADGGYSFNDLASFRAGNWSQFQQRFGLGGLDAREAGTIDLAEKELALFLQTDFRLGSSVKLGVGLRYDKQEHPDFPIADFSDPLATTMPLTQKIRNDAQFSPRLSLTWTPEADGGKTVVRASAGRYVSRTPSIFLYQTFTVNGVRAAQYTFSAAQAGLLGIPIGAAFNPNSPFRFASLPAAATAAAPDLFTYDPNFHNPHTDRVNLGAERAFGGWVLGINTTYAKSKDLERLKDINLGAPVANAQGRLVFPTTRPNANFRQLAVYTSDAEGRYQAVTLSAKFQKEDSPLQAQFFYTYAQDKDNDSNERNFSSYSTQNTQDLDSDYSYSDRDRRHVFSGYVSYLESITKIQSALSVRYQSGTPYSLTNSNDLNRDGVRGNDRLYQSGVDSGRNSQRNASTLFIDLKLSRSFAITQKVKFGVSAEVFNLLNRQDVFTVPSFRGTDAAPTFATANVLSGGNTSTRRVQLGARLSF
jgi:TonB dependent receptor